jgi:hypothetical protein
MWKNSKPGYNTPQMRRDGFELYKKEKEMAKRGRKPGSTSKKKTLTSNVLTLIEALNFIALGQKKAGTTPQCYSVLSANWLVASNGILMLATKVADDMQACPHTLQFLDALSKCHEEVSITQLTQNAISVNCGDFRAIIPCANYDELALTITAPDVETNPVGNKLKTAFKLLTPMLNEKAEHGYLASVCLKQNSVIATNGTLLIELWHGMNLPGEFLIPKSSAHAIAECNKNLKGFGASANSVTFYFDDGSFLKSQLFSEKFPPYEHFFLPNINPWALPEKFFQAIRSIESFTADGIVYFTDGFIASATNSNIASTFRIEGLPNNMAFNSKYLLMCESAMKNVFFDTNEDQVFFFGEMVRGIIKGVGYESKSAQDSGLGEALNNDIPF